MTIASELTKLNTNMQNAYTALEAKGATLPSVKCMDNLVSCIESVETGSGSSEFVCTRVKDDSGNEIGTHACNFTDADGKTYKVVVLDAAYRLANGIWMSTREAVTDMPLYSDNVTSYWDSAKETATKNCDLILAHCELKGYTSSAVSHCRSKSFIIGGTTYYGQLPNMREVFDFWRNRATIESMDPTASSSSSLNFSTKRNVWSSTQYNTAGAWHLYTDGNVYHGTKTGSYFVAPVLEIPLTTNTNNSGGVA